MIGATRRDTLKGVLAVPAMAALPMAARAASGPAVLVYDPALAEARELAALWQGMALAIAGDTVRFAREVLAKRPSRIAGISRAADALLIADVAAEAGYRHAPAGAAALTRISNESIGWLLVAAV